MAIKMSRISLALAASSLLISSSVDAQKLVTPADIGQPSAELSAEAQQAEVKDIRPSGPPIRLNVSQGTMIQLPAIPATVFVADSAVADVVVQPQPADAVLLTGKKAGVTALYAVDKAGNVMLSRVVDVRGGPVTIFRGSHADTGETAPIILTIPLTPAAPNSSAK